jgi:hypothetical protein
MTTEEIETLAKQFLADVPGYVWDGASLPVPIEEIADSHLGLLVREADDLGLAPGAPAPSPGQSLSGLLLPNRGEIWVNSEEARQWPGRRRFTIAHEIGHWQLHLSNEQPSYCRAYTVEEAAEKPLPLTESEANAFAAAVLLPSNLLAAEYAKSRDFNRLRALFGSSGAALGRRLHAVI